MAISSREKKYVLVCLIAVGLFGLYFVVLAPLRGMLGESRQELTANREDFALLRQDVKRKIELEDELKALEEKLGVSVPKGSVQEQQKDFVQKIEQAVKKSQGKLSSLAPVGRRTRRRAAVAPVGSTYGYSLNFETNQPGFVKFLKALEELGPPVMVGSVKVKGNPKKPDKLNVAMELQTYVFDGAKK